jgi:methionine synthase II (cobalamin-independent)
MTPNTEHVTSPSSLVEKAFAQRKQAQLDTQANLEKTINQCLRDARRAAVRITERSLATQGE